MSDVQIEACCMLCNEWSHFYVNADGLERWRKGEFIQIALPELSEDIRELLISRVCGQCFDFNFEEEDCPDCGVELTPGPCRSDVCSGEDE